jgi:4-hydroxy-tetrahydrodipicolinate synthase
MPAPASPRGVWCATLTPIDADGCPDHARLAAHGARLLASGVDGIALFGTTGEGQSFSLAERRAGLEALLASGIAPDKIIPGTACAAVSETIDLTRHAVQAGCSRVLLLPPFFFKGVSDEGVYASYARVIDGVADDRLRVYLYHIPQVTGVPISAEVIERLVASYPASIVGVKDSSCDLGHEQALVKQFSNLDIFVGFEPHLPAAVAAGGVGTICGIANVYPRVLRRLFDARTDAARRVELDLIDRLLVLLEGYSLMPAFKAIQAALTGDDAWLDAREPLVALDAIERRALLEGLKATGLDPARDAAGPY